MAIDYSYPNDDAIDAIGILDKFNNGEIAGHTTKHDPGWIQTVIDNVQADIQSNSNSASSRWGGGSSVDWSDYTAEEKAAYEWYRDEVIETDHWKAIAAEWEKTRPEPKDVKDPAFSENTQYTDEPMKDYTVPNEINQYKGGDNEKGELKVSLAAIRHFAAEIEKIAPNGKGLLLDASNKLHGLDIKPGKFAKAEKLRLKIVGDGDSDTGLVGDTQGLLQTVHQALYLLRENLVKMADSYEYTEEHNLRAGKDLEDKTKEFNNITTEDFTSMMDKPWAKIENIGDYGQGDGTGGGAGVGGTGENTKK